MGGKTSIQFNCMVQKASHIRILDSLTEGDILPIMWFEIVSMKLALNIYLIVNTISCFLHRYDKIK